MTIKFGKVQQIAAFEDNGLPLFDGNPAKTTDPKKVVWVASVWEPWLNMEAPEQPEKPETKQDRLF